MRLSFIQENHPTITVPDPQTGNQVQIDKQLYPLIQALWKAGYSTGGCCQGGAYYAKDKARLIKLQQTQQYDQWAHYAGYIALDYKRTDPADRARTLTLAKRFQSIINDAQLIENNWDKWQADPSKTAGSFMIQWPEALDPEIIKALIHAIPNPTQTHTPQIIQVDPSGDYTPAMEIASQLFGRWLSGIDKELQYIALIDDEVAGAIAANWYNDDEDDGAYIYGFDIVVVPKYRGTKIAAALIHRAIEEYDKNKQQYGAEVLRLQVINPNLAQYLQRLGFQPVSDWDPHDGVKMERQ